ncbi:hypothetical protein ACQR1Y_16315 [Bradyrhizobium sp. HKCCYLRH3099]|uniref:hypothetical protein n=1 Tax=unclassified Bradyrhizobium TaxID=2631580 RepID=UPI003EBF0D0B
MARCDQLTQFGPALCRPIGERKILQLVTSAICKHIAEPEIRTEALGEIETDRL